MKLNPQSKQYLKHFKYLKSIQAESVTPAYTYHPNVLKNKTKLNKKHRTHLQLAKNIQKYFKKNNTDVDYMNIYSTDLKVLSTNTNLKVLQSSAIRIRMYINDIPCILLISSGQVYLFGKCITDDPHKHRSIGTAQFQIGNGYYVVGSDKVHDNMYFWYPDSTEETNNTVLQFLKEQQYKELSEEEEFMYSTVIDNPELFKNAYKLTKHVQELISTSKKIHHLITYINTYA